MNSAIKIAMKNELLYREKHDKNLSDRQ